MQVWWSTRQGWRAGLADSCPGLRELQSHCRAGWGASRPGKILTAASKNRGRLTNPPACFSGKLRQPTSGRRPDIPVTTGPAAFKLSEVETSRTSYRRDSVSRGPVAEQTPGEGHPSTLCRCLDCNRQVTKLATSPRNPHTSAPLPPPFYPASHQPSTGPARSCLCPPVGVAGVDGLTSCCLRVYARDHHLTH